MTKVTVTNNGEYPTQSISLDVLLVEGQAKKTAYVDLTDLGVSGGLWVRELNAKQRGEMRKMAGRITQTKGGDSVIDTREMDSDSEIKVFLWAVCTDNTGKELMFEDGRQRQQNMQMVRNFGTAIIDRVVKQVRDISGLSDDKDETEDEDTF